MEFVTVKNWKRKKLNSHLSPWSNFTINHRMVSADVCWWERLLSFWTVWHPMQTFQNQLWRCWRAVSFVQPWQLMSRTAYPRPGWQMTSLSWPRSSGRECMLSWRRNPCNWWSQSRSNDIHQLTAPPPGSGEIVTRKARCLGFIASWSRSLVFFFFCY